MEKVLGVRDTFFSECSDFTYGLDCHSNCTCNINHTTSCDPVNGTCNCLSGWHGNTCDDDINECELDPCGQHANCTNTPSSFDCACLVGYSNHTGSGCTGSVCSRNKNEYIVHCLLMLLQVGII